MQVYNVQQLYRTKWVTEESFTDLGYAKICAAQLRQLSNGRSKVRIVMVRK